MYTSLLALLVLEPLLAAPPAIPTFVVEYMARAGLDYAAPLGRFDDYLLKVFAEHNDPEPWAVSDDFNGDGILDWSGLLRDADGNLNLLSVYSNKSDYSHQILTPLGADGDNLDTAVVLQPPGQINGFLVDDTNESPQITITNPGVHLFYFEKASVLYYWDQGTFREFVTSD